MYCSIPVLHYLSLSPGVCSDSCPLSQWCYLTILFILCHPILLLPSMFPSIRVFPNESALLIRWPKHYSFSISPSDEQQGWVPSGLAGSVFWCITGPYFTIRCSISNSSPAYACSTFWTVGRTSHFTEAKSGSQIMVAEKANGKRCFKRK